MTTAACGGNNTATPAITPTTVAAVASAACSDGLPHGPIDRIKVTVQGRERTALVHLPASPTATVARAEPLPVVLSFHGFSGNAALQGATDGLAAQSDEHGFVSVHPEGLLVGLSDQVTGASGWDPEGNEVDEPAFVAALLDELGAQTCIDPSRVYATGFSAGGYIALVVACALPERIVAVAAVAAAYQSAECPPTGRAIPTLAFHGLDDIITPFEGRRSEQAGTFVPVTDALEAVAARNGCAGTPEVAAVTPTVESVRWTRCAAPTVLYRLRKHGHSWPGHPMPVTEDLLTAVLTGNATQPANPLPPAIGETPASMAQNVLLTNLDIDATSLIWDFFAALPGRAG
ncbi:MAG: hypothetical protein EXQ71_10705 [Acidimicrobiia bacterium]|nr:hypothetical protein [Acidimicrobiia bacterium]